MFCAECGTRLPQGSIFCPECGTRVSNFVTKTDLSAYAYRLLLVTKYEALAQKYDMGKQEVESVLDDVVSRLRAASIDTVLCDFSHITADEKHWEEYKVAMLDAIKQLGWPEGPDTYVMIIGGDDCIPMPRDYNPIYEKEENIGLEQLHCDFLYSLGTIPYTCDFTGNNDELTILDEFNDVNFIISRLPLADDDDCKYDDSTFEQDMNAYFDKAIPKLKGIDVNRIIMTSAQVWIPASTYMISHLPSVNLSQYLPSSARDGNVVIAPEVDMGNKTIYSQFDKAYQGADMVLFNLHGSNGYDSSAYYGQKGANYPSVVSPDTIGSTSASIITTCACYGARFVGYPRHVSMLLSSLYEPNNNIVLFAGSCTVALGSSPHGYSETMLRIYTEYLMSGMPSGQAWTKAKFDYIKSTSDDSKGALATFLMFNLYGLPMLHVKTNNQSKYKKLVMEKQKTPVKKTYTEERVTLFKRNSDTKQMGILEEVQNAVDANLAVIRQTIEKELYDTLGLKSDDLSSIESYVSTDENGVESKGYYFNYIQKNDLFTSKIYAQTDEKGRILKTVHTK